MLTLFGIFNVYGEVVIRLFSGTKYSGKAYNIYYLIPIRAHALVALFSFLLFDTLRGMLQDEAGGLFYCLGINFTYVKSIKFNKIVCRS